MKNTKETYLQFILNELRQTSPIALTENTSVLKSGILDSIGLVELLVNLQKQFGIQIDLADVKRDSFDTPELMAEFLSHHFAESR
ncbi:MAG: hypothetical protein IPJ84_00090 [Bdellovibrionales bacterium]|nr:hypothetical protein [Bdellovibrionales bacterium]